MDARQEPGLLDRVRQLASVATAPLLITWFLLVGAYAWYVNGDFISRDQWHFLPMVDHYLSGTLDWHELWQSHTEHVKPGYYLLFLWNARFLGLNMQVEILSGIVLLGMATWLLLRNMAGGRDARMPPLALLAAGAVLMSFNQWANYGYGLLSLGGFGGMLAQSLVMLGFSALLTRGLDLRRGALLALALVFAVLGFSGARGPAVVGTCLVTAVAAWWLMSEARTRILRQGGAFVLAGCVAIGVYLALLHYSAPVHAGVGGGLEKVLLHPLAALGYVSGVLTQSVLALSMVGGSRLLLALVTVLPLGAWLLLGWCLWRYFRAAHWKSSWMPLLLIAYSALFTLEVLVGRFGSDNGQLHGSEVPRYVFDAHLWLVGCAWILGLDWLAQDTGAKSGLKRLVPPALLAAMLALELINLGLAGRSMPLQMRANARVALQLRMIADGAGTTADLPKWECPGQGLCADGIEILKKYDLSFVRDAADPAVLTRLQQQAAATGAKPPPR